MQMRGYVAVAAIALTLLAIGIPARADDPPLLAPGQGPPPSGVSEPKVTPIKGDDGIHHQSWFAMSFLDLRTSTPRRRNQARGWPSFSSSAAASIARRCTPRF